MFPDHDDMQISLMANVRSTLIGIRVTMLAEFLVLQIVRLLGCNEFHRELLWIINK